MIKVSVVVPTYQPGKGLDRVVQSVDAQTLPTSEFEVIFVDDGSPDDTLETLLAIQKDRPNVRVERIENSGWPSRPRNVGTDLAVGEYVSYLDHDDVLFPDALRSAYEFAKENNADVVSAKEARTHDAEWAMDTYVADVGNSRGRTDQHPLVPMNPHKLYRRDFLNEHAIRFREDGRVLWEDIFFNLKVARYAKVISTLASSPFYHWYLSPGSTSTGFLRSNASWWRWLREVLVAINDDLGDEAHKLERTQMLAHQYRVRLVSSFDGRFRDRPAEEQDMIYAEARQLQEDFFPPELDDELNGSQRIRAALLRANERELLANLPALDPGIPGWATTTALAWVDGKLSVSALAKWVSPKGRRHALVWDGDRIVKDLPADYAAAVKPELLDATDEIRGAQARIGLRSRASRETWMVPSDYLVDISDDRSQPVTFSVSTTATVDPATAAFGEPLQRGVWDLNARCTLAGSSQQQRLRTTIDPIVSTDGQTTFVAYRNKDGMLSLDIGQSVKKVSAVARPRKDDVTIVATGKQRLVRVPLEQVEITGIGNVRTSVVVATASRSSGLIRGILRREDKPDQEIQETVSAMLAVRPGGAYLEFSLPRGWRSAVANIGLDRADVEGPVLIEI